MIIMDTLGIIICSKDRPDLLPKLFENIFDQTKPPEQIVIVDNSNSEKNFIKGRQYINTFLSKIKKTNKKSKIKVNYLNDQSGKGLPHARNFGKKIVDTDIILFLDDDVNLDPEYTKNLLSFYARHPKAGGACGNLVQPQQNRLSSRLRMIFGAIFLFDSLAPFQVLPSGWGSHPYGANKTKRVTWLSGCNMSYRKEVLREFDSDEDIPTQGGGEDRDLSYRASKQYPIYVVTECKGMHEMIKISRPNLGESNKRAIYGNAYFYKKNISKNIFTHIAFWWSTFGYMTKTVFQILLSKQGQKLSQLKVFLSGLILISRLF
jgi:GT2 family glycosyltransferase